MYKDFDKLSSDELDAKFNADASKASAFIKSQAQKQAVATVLKAGGVAAAAHATGVSEGVFYLLVGE